MIAFYIASAILLALGALSVVLAWRQLERDRSAFAAERETRRRIAALMATGSYTHAQATIAACRAAWN